MDRFNADFSGDDIKLTPVACSKGVCDCSERLPDERCGMTAEQAQAYVAKCYRLKAEYIEGLTKEAFLLDYAGVYPS